MGMPRTVSGLDSHRDRARTRRYRPDEGMLTTATLLIGHRLTGPGKQRVGDNCGQLGLARCGGRLGFLDGLVGDGMSLRGAAQLAELVSYDSGFGDGSQHADSCFAAFQLAAEPLAIRLIQSQVLVVKRAQQPTAYQPCS